MMEILSIGHSTLEYGSFVARLKAEGVTALADVRTSPYSRHYPHFNRNELKSSLARDNIAYVFLGRELGGRPDQPELYTNGIADYEKMACTPVFARGLERLQNGAKAYRVAVMCSERNPVDCHRCLLVGRALKARGYIVRHLLPDGQSVDQDAIEDQLLKMADKSEADMFVSPRDMLAEAYRLRARKVAFAEADPEFSSQVSIKRGTHDPSSRRNDRIHQE